MFRHFANDAFGVNRHAFKIKTVNNINLLATTLAPSAGAVLDAQELGTQDRFDNIFAKQTICYTLQIYSTATQPRSEDIQDDNQRANGSAAQRPLTARMSTASEEGQ